jgi:hypothetical protein
VTTLERPPRCPLAFLQRADTNHDAIRRVSGPLIGGLFTLVPRIKILRSPFAGSCIDRPPGSVRMASKGLHAALRRSLHLVVLDGDAGRRMLRRRRSRLSHFPKTYAKGAASSESNPAPPRPDPLGVWAKIAPSFGDNGDYRHLSALEEYPQSRISIHRCYKL